MKAKHPLILYIILGLSALLLALLAAVFALQAQRSAQALEDGCMQRLSEAQEHLQAAAVKLSKTPAAGGAEVQAELLAGVSLQAEGVVSDLSALPLSHAAMSDTIRFCNQLSEYALSLALRTASNGLDEAALRQLAELETQCTLLLGQLATARAEMEAQGLRLSGDDGAFYRAAQPSDQPLEQLADADGGMDYPSMIYDGAFSDARRLGAPKALGDGVIDQNLAIELARAFIGAERVRSAEASVETGGAIPCYGVRLTLTDGLVLNADMTRQGGKPLWIMPEHADFQPVLTLEECQQAGLAFLRERGYGDMEANHYQIYGGMAVINFVAVQDGVLLYPDLIKLQLRMDTGDVVGMESNNYLMNHVSRESLEPPVDEAEARAAVSPRLAVVDSRLCVIPWHDEEKLCWEFSGWYEENEYRVYIDATTGEEREVLLLIREQGSLLAA